MTNVFLNCLSIYLYHNLLCTYPSVLYYNDSYRRSRTRSLTDVLRNGPTVFHAQTHLHPVLYSP